MRPMLAEPTPRPPLGPQWRHEIKWDGIRALVSARHGVVRVHTRSGNECSARFPEITESSLRDYDDLLIDGEIVALREGVPDFRTVMHRLTPAGFRGSGSKPTPEETAVMNVTPIRFMAFDVLQAAEHDVTTLPWQARRTLLTGAGIESESIIVPEPHTDGTALFDATLAQGIEGVVSKHVEAPYRPGVRSDAWLKSVHRHTDSFVVGGWRPLEGSRGRLGALLVGEFIDGHLRYRGRVGTGFSQRSGEALLDVVVPSPACPFDHPDDVLPDEDHHGTHWVRPNVMIDITYLQHSAGGRLRQPSYKGLRLDLGVPRA